MRRVLLLALGMLLAACSHNAEPSNKPTPDQTVVQANTDADRERLAALQAVRQIDDCALYGGADSVLGHKMTVLGRVSARGCDARIDGEPRPMKASIDLDVALPSAVMQPDSGMEPVTIDGTEVIRTSPWGSPNAPPRNTVPAWDCVFTWLTPPGISLSTRVTASRDADGCGVGQELMRVALREYAKRPQLQASKFARLKFTGADPCAAVARLKPTHSIAWNIQDSTETDCAFSIDGSPEVLVGFSYGDPRMLDYDPTHWDVDGHRVAGDAKLGAFNVVVGPEFQSGDRKLLPEVSIVDQSRDMDRVRLIAQAVAEQY